MFKYTFHTFKAYLDSRIGDLKFDLLQELFLEHSAKRPVVVVAGVRVADLRAIMQFIYTGEVSVTEAGLADLLEVADMLGVRGLKAGAGGEGGHRGQGGAIPSLGR